MKKLLLLTLTLTAFIFTSKAQDSTALSASQKETNPPFPASYASVQTLSGSNLRITGDWTIEAWIKIGFNQSQLHIVETYSMGNSGGFALRIQGSKVRAIQISGPSSTSVVSGTTTIPIGEWHHIAATLNETTQELKVFLDGELEGTATTTLKTKNTNVGLYIGARGDDRKVSGIVQIDDVKIWNIARTKAKIQADTLACFTGNETGLLAMYDFENITGNALKDRTPNGNTGNLVDANFVSRIYTCKTATPVGVTEISKPNLSIYPNPASSEITIETEETIMTIQIFDLFGSLVQQETTGKFSINNLSAGVYIAAIQTETGMKRMRFVKQ